MWLGVNPGFRGIFVIILGREGIGCNFQKYLGHTRKGRGLFINVFIRWEGWFRIKIKGRVSFVKGLER